MVKALWDVISEQKKGKPLGMYSVCSANPCVIEASLEFEASRHRPLLIEATCNQVNQFGGYTGMKPGQFAEFVKNLAAKFGLPEGNLILGGDHLGPYPWRTEAARIAMSNAKQMMHDYVAAGFSKIHLDASMPCADDPGPELALEISAERTAQLCQAAEESFEKSGRTDPIVYVIGTEVPPPGGIEKEDGIHVTRQDEVEEMIAETRSAFSRLGLEDAWERVIAVVVHPGVDYGNAVIYPYDRKSATHLSDYVRTLDQFVFEAHSTDYQTETALTQMVEDQFAILKVGPELTFAYREAVFALECIEKELLGVPGSREPSNLRTVIDTVMVENPGYWQNYYSGTAREKLLSRKYSYSDRIRYYWPEPKIQDALRKLVDNLLNVDIPDPLVSQFFPIQVHKVKEYRFSANPVWLIKDKIGEVLRKYAAACGE